MTTRTSWTIRCLVWSLPVLLVTAAVWKAFHPTVIRYKNHVAQVKQVGLALKLFADDHDGTLPQRLEDVMPTYFNNKELLMNVQFMKPSAKPPELTPRTVIALKLYPEDQMVGEVHADMTAEAHKL